MFLSLLFKSTRKQFLLKRSQSPFISLTPLHSNFHGSIPLFYFSRFGSREKKLEDLNKQLSNYSKKNNLQAMLITKVKIIKLHEKTNGCEFYNGFCRDYIDVSKILRQKHDYEESITLINDGIAFLKKKIAQQQKDDSNDASEKNVEDVVESDTDDQRKSKQCQKQLTLQDDLLKLNIELALCLAKDPKRSGEEVFENVEELQSQVKNLVQTSQLRLIESLMYGKTGSLKDAVEISQAVIIEIAKKEEELEIAMSQKDILNEQNFQQEQQDLLDIRCELFCVLLNSKILLADNSNVANIVEAILPILEKIKNPELKSQILSSLIDATLMNGQFQIASALIEQLTEFLTDNHLDKPLQITKINLQTAQLLHHTSHVLHTNSALDIALQNIQTAQDADASLIWRALHLKAITLLSMDQIDSSERIFLTNRREMELRKNTETALYYETLLHLALISMMQKKTEVVKDLVGFMQKSILNNTNFGRSSSIYLDVQLFEGLTMLGDNTSKPDDQTQQLEKTHETGLILVRECCMRYRKNPPMQLWIRTVALNILKELLRQKQLFKEILYVNVVLETIHFKPRLYAADNEQLQAAYQENCQQTELLKNMLELQSLQ